MPVECLKVQGTFRTAKAATTAGAFFFILLFCVVAAMAEAPTAPRRDPSDPGQRVPPVVYLPVTGNLRAFRPVEPLPWDAVNRRVAPKPGAGATKPHQGQGH